MFGSVPLSYLNEASVLRPCFEAVLRIETGLKYATSKKTFFVVGFTPEFSPPKTPAMAIGPSVLQMAKSVPFSFRLVPSRVVNSVPAEGHFTMILFPAIASASKICMGWPR